MYILTVTSFFVIFWSVTCFITPNNVFRIGELRNHYFVPFNFGKQPFKSIQKMKFSEIVFQHMSAVDMNWDPKSGPKLDFNEDYYSLLEIDPAITSKDMKKAYYKIVFKYHPDNKEGKDQKELCNKQMMVINAAYKVLKDGDARKVYDRKRMSGVYGEAAKAGKSTGGSSNGRSTTQQSQSTKASSSSSSSGYSSSDSQSNNNRYNPGNEDSYQKTESLNDIFSDLWSEIRKGESKNIMGDLLDFLEDQVLSLP
jgi:hypothetical protein